MRLLTGEGLLHGFPCCDDEVLFFVFLRHLDGLVGHDGYAAF